MLRSKQKSLTDKQLMKKCKETFILAAELTRPAKESRYARLHTCNSIIFRHGEFKMTYL